MIKLMEKLGPECFALGTNCWLELMYQAYNDGHHHYCYFLGNLKNGIDYQVEITERLGLVLLTRGFNELLGQEQGSFT